MLFDAFQQRKEGRLILEVFHLEFSSFTSSLDLCRFKASSFMSFLPLIYDLFGFWSIFMSFNSFVACSIEFGDLLSFGFMFGSISNQMVE